MQQAPGLYIDTRSDLFKAFLLRNLFAIMSEVLCSYKYIVERFSRKVLNLRLKGHWFEIHGRHSLVSFSKTLYPLLSTGSTQEKREKTQHD